MPLRRLQLFEFNDAPWAPEPLRDALVETLSRAIRWGKLADGLVDPLHALLQAAGTHEVLDLCAGAGGPAAVIRDAFARRGLPVHFLETDLFPHVDAWRGHGLDFVPTPVDATAIDPALAPGRVRVMVNALHHFPPGLAREVVRGACANAPGVFIAEGLTRNPLSFAAMSPVGLVALLADPLFAKRHRLARAWLTWGSPVSVLASAWDGTVSALRQYTADELREMVSDLPGWHWSHGEGAHAFGLGRFTWFAGVGTRR